jgi:Protein of unknown function (DUF998)
MSPTLDRVQELLRREVPIKRSRDLRRKVLLACGLGSSATYVVANVAGALRGGRYSTVNQSVSELTAVGAPSRAAALPVFVVSDALALAFGIGVLESAGRNGRLRVAGWALVGVGVLDMVSPFTPMHVRERLAAGEQTGTDTAHLWVTSLTTLLILAAMAFGAAGLGKRFRIYSIASVVAMTGGGLLTLTQKKDVAANLPTPLNGVYERIGIGGYLLWMAVLAVILLRAAPAPR